MSTFHEALEQLEALATARRQRAEKRAARLRSLASSRPGVECRSLPLRPREAAPASNTVFPQEAP